MAEPRPNHGRTTAESLKCPGAQAIGARTGGDAREWGPGDGATQGGGTTARSQDEPQQGRLKPQQAGVQASVQLEGVDAAAPT